MSNKTLSQEYGKPCSVCTCGHTGDGPGSEHKDRIASNGHGACKICGNKCPAFTWKEFTPGFQKFIDKKNKS